MCLASLVRRLVGRDRYSSRAAYHPLQRLCELVRVQGNFFQSQALRHWARAPGNTYC